MRISGSLYADADTNPPLKPTDNLGQADFLRLMTEQLKHQDPLKPLENNEFLGQLAQFSTVQGINNLQTSLQGMSNAMNSDQVLRGAALVGHTVLVPSDKINLDEKSTEISGVVAANAPGTIDFTITDANGEPVKTIHVDAKAAGEVKFSWDGTNTEGKRMPAGNYSISAAQKNPADGKKSPLSTYLQATVDSISIGSDGLYMNLAGLGAVPVAWALRIS